MDGKRKKALKEFGIITVGTVIIGTAVFFGLQPAHVSVGSISGLAVVLSNFIPLPLSAITLALNLILLIFGFFTCGSDFGLKTVYSSILLPAVLRVYESLLPGFVSLTGDQLTDMCIYLFIVSIGLSMLFTANASSGGLDIIAKFLNRYCHMEFGSAMAAPGYVVALTSALVYDGKTVVLSLIGTYLGGVLLDRFIFGMDEKKRVCIITSEFETVRRFIVTTLRSGCTVYESEGGYTGEKRREIVVIVDKHEYRKLMDYLKAVDPKAFLTVYTVNKIQYQPK